MNGDKALTSLSIEASSSLDAVAVMQSLGVERPSGLASAEAQRRVREFGPNAIPVRRAQPAALLVRQFRSPLLLLLLGASMLSALLGDPTDAIIIGVIVALSAGLGFANEYRAARAAETPRDQIEHAAVVRRDGNLATVGVPEIAPGDLVTLKLGDVVPADLRLVETADLECDESVLTGEGAPVEKSTISVPAGTAVADLSCCALAGTAVSSGSGVGVAVATGAHTKFGAIAAGLSSRDVETEFQRGLRTFSISWCTSARCSRSRSSRSTPPCRSRSWMR